ncbi:MAG: serine/threonine protein kinase [Gammaproteobacteria bacterium]|nr:serine/threonine protein kinase [Gammaproteobacteria bacterium]MCP5459225.1 serine/threonine protein kinase [Gammaproteobacteria bacterium]
MVQTSDVLRIGSSLEEYVIEAVLGAGAFGITYKALDTHLNTPVAIKEYFPTGWSYRDADGLAVHPNSRGRAALDDDVTAADYFWGLDRFFDESQALAAVKHPHVARIHRYFRANGTAYIVMDYEAGRPLSALLTKGATLPEHTLLQMLQTVLPALRTVHEGGYLHRDIKPSNLYLRDRDQQIMLIDFGSARDFVGRRSRNVTSIVTPSYSPPEQYVTHQNHPYGPWTDIYALGAVLYRCISGYELLDATARLLGEPLRPITVTATGRYSPRLLAVVEKAITLHAQDRYQSIAEMEAALYGLPDTAEPCAATLGEGNALTRKLKTPLIPRRSIPMPLAALRAYWPTGPRLNRLGIGLGVIALGGLLLARHTPAPQEDSAPRYSFYPHLKLPATSVKPPITRSPDAIPSVADNGPHPEPSLSAVGDLAISDSPIHGAPRESPTTSGRDAPTGDPTASDPSTSAAASASQVEEPAGGDSEEIARLLALGQQSLTAYQLTTPENQNATLYFRRVLELDPANQAARRGLDQVLASYVQLTKQAIDDGRYSKARRHIAAGLTVAPDNAELLALQARTHAARPQRMPQSPDAATLAERRRVLKEIFSDFYQVPRQSVGFNDK